MELQGNRHVLLALLFILFLVGAGLIYYYLLQPVQTDLHKVKAELRTEEDLLASISSQLQEKQALTVVSTMDLQLQLPVDPLVDQFLLHLEDVLMKTNNEISSIKLADNQSKVKPVIVPNDDENNSVAVLEAAAGQATSNKEEDNGLAMPDTLKRISLEMALKAKDYQDIKNFLTEIEELERIILIDLIEFEVPENRGSDKEQYFEYKVTLSIFYVEELNDLLDELPQEEFVKPANKMNPISTGGKYSIGLDIDLVEHEESESTGHSQVEDLIVSPTSAFSQSKEAVQPSKTNRPTSSILPLRISPNTAHSYYVLQAGAFSTAQAAEQAAAQLSEKGWATYIQQEIPPNRVYIGMATSLQDAYTLGEWYREQGKEVFVRNLRVGSLPTTIRGLGEEEYNELLKFIEDSYTLIDYLSEFSIANLAGSDLVKLSEQQSQLNFLLDKVNKGGDELLGELSAAHAQGLLDLLAELNSGWQELNTSQDGNKKQVAWRIQQYVLDYALRYEKWLRELI